MRTQAWTGEGICLRSYCQQVTDQELILCRDLQPHLPPSFFLSASYKHFLGAYLPGAMQQGRKETGNQNLAIGAYRLVEKIYTKTI